MNLTAFPSGGLSGGCSPAGRGLGRSAMSSLVEPVEYIYLDAKLSRNCLDLTRAARTGNRLYLLAGSASNQGNSIAVH